MRVSVLTEATFEPVTLDEAKEHLRVTHDADNTYIANAITAARQWLERSMDRAVCLQTLEALTENFERSQRMPGGACVAANAVEVLRDGARVAVNPDTWRVAFFGDSPAKLVFSELPSHDAAPDACRVEYVCGWTSRDTVPRAVKQACLILLSEMYENRSQNEVGTIVQGNPTVERLISSYRFPSLS